MTSYLILAVSAIILALIAVRFASRRQSIPCPPWLIPLLENPYMNAVAGSRVLLERAGVQPGMSVLDVGCGPGRIAIPAARLVGPEGRVVALDLQPGMIRRLEERISALGLDRIETILAGAGDGKMPKSSFDRALLVTVLGEIVDRSAALREIYDALKPGGTLSITEVLPDPHYQTRSRVRRLAESAGFRFDELLGPCYAFTMNLIKPTAEHG